MDAMGKHIALFILSFMFLATPIRLSAERTVWVYAPGELQHLFDTNDLKYENNLTLQGSINGSDVKVLRKWANPQDLGGLPLPDNYRGLRIVLTPDGAKKVMR